MLIYLVVSSTKDIGGTRFFFLTEMNFGQKNITLFIIEFFVSFNLTLTLTTTKKTDTQVQTTLLKISILKNTPTNWRLLHPNFQMIHS